MYSNSNDNPGSTHEQQMEHCAIACMSHKTPKLESGSVGNYGGSVWPSEYSAQTDLLLQLQAEDVTARIQPRKTVCLCHPNLPTIRLFLIPLGESTAWNECGRYEMTDVGPA